MEDTNWQGMDPVYRIDIQTIGMVNQRIFQSDTSPNSKYTKNISGVELSRPGSRAQTTRITVQIIPDDPKGDYEVHLLCGVNTISSAQMDKFATFTQDDAKVGFFGVSQGCLYQAEHISGVGCRILMTG